MADTPTENISGYRSAGNYVPGMGMGYDDGIKYPPNYVPGMDMNQSGYVATGKNYIPGMGMDESQNPFKAEQSTEQSTPKAPYIPLTPEENKTKAVKSDAAPAAAAADAAAPEPTNVAEENTPPPTVTTDVVRDFDWTASINKQQMLEKIPYIRLTEFKLTANNAIHGFAAAAMAFADVHRSSVAGASKLGGAAQAITQSTFMSPVGDAAAGAADMIGAAGAAVAPYLQKAENYIKSKTSDSFGPEGQHLVDLFGSLYARQPTGRVYVMPYYDKSFFQTNNTFSDSSEGMPPLVGGLFDGVAEAGKIPSLVEPGVYVQRPKFYQFTDTPEPSITFSLTLYNTLTPMSYLKHAKFIQQLALNNLPRRFTRVIVEPPCIYEVLIPGRAFYPYCFISKLQVSNVGNRRLINNEIVPDAFQIEITLTSLIKDANNLYEKQMKHHGLELDADDSRAPAPGAGGTAGDVAKGGGDNKGASGEKRTAVAEQPAQKTAVDNRDKVIPLDRNGNATDGSGDSIYNYINAPGASPKFIVPPENKPMFIKPKPTSQSFGVEG